MKKSWRWPAIVIALIVLNMGLVGVTIYYASSDPSAATEPDYYRKALEWDALAKQRDQSRTLGWTVTTAPIDGDNIVMTLNDRFGVPVRDAVISGVVFAQARAGQRLPLNAVETEPGVYRAPIAFTRAGLWRVELTAKRGETLFLSEFDVDLVELPATHRDSATTTLEVDR